MRSYSYEGPPAAPDALANGPGLARTAENPCRPASECYSVTVKFTIELDREADGRWIAEVPELNVLLYGNSREDAIQRARSAAREIVLDRIARAELPPDSANATFEVAA
jgi:predicted RNase H-like HicB family nuclease